MATFIPEDKITEVKTAADIVDIVSESVLLKQSGRNFLGLCPFHSEKTPSFTVSREKQIFYCFGCGAGGNVITFLMKHDGFSFPEAVRSLARRYGIDVPTKALTPEQKRARSERELLIAANTAAMAFYRKMLLDPGRQGHGLAYLEKRGFRRSIIDQFGLGYAPEGWDRLLAHLRRKGLAPAILEKAGLILPRRDGSGFYDRFRHRIMFPIFNAYGQVIGFGGRVLDDSLPKYLNSPETPLYSKSRTLYGLHGARTACRQQQSVYIVEGYFDLLAMVQHGILNVVATLGTALTAEHVNTLRSLIGPNGSVGLVFDSDAAGLKAAGRSIDVFDKAYVDAKIIVLPDGSDPDTFLFQEGADAFHRVAGGALDVIEYLIESAVREHGLTVSGKSKIVAAMATPLARIQDGVKRGLYIRRLAEQLGVDEPAILERVRQSESVRTQPDRRAPNPTASPVPSRRRGDRLERKIVAMMLQFPEIIPEVVKRRVPDHFQDSTLIAIAEAVIDCRDPGQSAAQAAKNLPNGDAVVAELLIDSEEWNTKDGLKLIHELMERSPLREENALLEEIRNAERTEDQALLQKLLERKHKLAVRKQKERRELLNMP